MYNGIGLPTPRGSGTNGFVQRNLAYVSKKRQMKPKIVSEPDKDFDKPPNPELVLHQKKREIEAKCMRLRKELEEEGWREKRIDEEVDDYRRRKLSELLKSDKFSALASRNSKSTIKQASDDLNDANDTRSK